MDDFLLRALAGGIGVAIIAAPLGCLVVWRHMAYFGATLAHAALLGVALGFLIDIGPTIGIIAVCCLIAIALALLQGRRTLATDTVLGILAHGTLAFGLIALAFMETLRIDLMAYLFGDILAISDADLAWIYGGGLFVLIAVLALWRPLLMMTVHEDLARIDGVPIEVMRFASMVLIAVVIAIAMKIVGILLIVSLLIIPPAAARGMARSPESMAAGAALVGCLAVLGGLGASWQWNAPAGPAIVAVATIIFLLSLFTRRQTSAG